MLLVARQAGPEASSPAVLFLSHQQIVFANNELKLLCPRVHELFKPGLHGYVTTVFGSQSVTWGFDFFLNFEHSLMVVGEKRNVVIVNVLIETGAEQLLARVAEEERHPGVHEGELPVRRVSAGELEAGAGLLASLQTICLGEAAGRLRSANSHQTREAGLCVPACFEVNRGPGVQTHLGQGPGLEVACALDGDVLLIRARLFELFYSLAVCC